MLSNGSDADYGTFVDIIKDNDDVEADQIGEDQTGNFQNVEAFEDNENDDIQSTSMDQIEEEMKQVQ